MTAIGLWARRGAIAFALVVMVAIGLDRLDRAFPPPLADDVALSIVVTDRGGRVLRVFPVDDGRWRLAADLDALDPRFVEALIALEDQRFAEHHGVDWLALGRAALGNLTSGRVVSGGSTITMQTARLLEPKPRTLAAKVQQMVRAIQLERRLTKREILELYLTLAPYGGNLEGVRAASHAYFDREPAHLAPDQIALLVALPQAPEARRPDLRPEAAQAARARVLSRMAEGGLIGRDRAREAMTSPAPIRRPFPSEAWHASAMVGARADALGLDGRANLRSTLDMGLQLRVQALVRQAADAAGPDVQASVVVVETASGAVRAAVGSVDRGRAGGWMDLTDRRRSPGSTLKPFIYAMAFDDGLADAETRLADVPQRFGGYRPDNFDRVFHGDVSLTDALRHSLNVPAVMMLDAVGASRFTRALEAAGVAVATPGRVDGAPGLAVALGGLGVSVRDVAMLYAALEQEGLARPLVWLEDDMGDDPPLRRVMSAETANEVVAILRDGPAPAGRAPAHLTRNTPNIAFKTGTSYGYRDTWAAGVAGGYAVVVWVGRADGAAQGRTTGREAALPTLFDIFDALASQGLLAREIASPPPQRHSRGGSRPLAAFDRFEGAPEILFPPDGVEVLAEPDGDGEALRPFVLAGRGAGPLEWYVDGAQVDRDGLGAPIWTPRGSGFFLVTAVDGQGRSARSLVRVRLAAG